MERDFNLCLAVDMSGSVCNDGKGSECHDCEGQAEYFPLFFSSECRDSFVSKDTCCDNFAKVKEFSSLVVDLLGDFSVAKSFSVVQFATDARTASGPTSAAHARRVIDGLDYTGGRTNHADALRRCQRSFPAGGRRQNFIMLVTDGVSSEPDFDPFGAAEVAATSAKFDGTFIIPVFISSNNDWGAQEFMQSLSSDGKVFDVTSFAGLNSLLDRLVDQVSCA